MLILTMFAALAIPLLIALLFTQRGARRFILFFLLGITACFMGSYINSFIVSVSAGTMDALEVAVKITPITEELLKALPLLFCFALFAPKREELMICAVFLGLGFATMESAYAIAVTPDADLLFAVTRGLSAGAVHTICSAALGFGLTLIGSNRRLMFPAAFAAVCAVTTLHAIYNLFITAGGGWSFAGALIPTAAGAALLIANRFFEQYRKGRPEADE